MSFATQTAIPETTPSLRWSAVAAGAATATGMMALLFALGLACGLSSVDVDVEGRLRTVGLFAGAWGALVPLVSLFLGGWVASRASGTTAPAAALLQGLVLWSVIAMATMYVAAATVGGIAGSAAALGRGAAQLGGQAIAQGVGALGQAGDAAGSLAGRAAEAFDLDADQVLRPVNARLQAAGRQPVTPEQLLRASRATVRAAMMSGRLDREVLVDSVVKETAISSEDANMVADGVASQVDRARARLGEAADMAQDRAKAALDRARTEGVSQVKAVANDVSDGVAKLFWGIFAALGLGLVAALGGAAAGVAQRRS